MTQAHQAKRQHKRLTTCASCKHLIFKESRTPRSVYRCCLSGETRASRLLACSKYEQRQYWNYHDIPAPAKRKD